MAGTQPAVRTLMTRFAKEVDDAFYPFIVLSVVQRCNNPSLKEIRLEISKLAGGAHIRSEASDKQLIGRMDKTFGLIDCVRADSEGRCWRINKKGAELLKLSKLEVIDPLLEIISIT